MDEKDVVHMHRGILFSHGKEEDPAVLFINKDKYCTVSSIYGIKKKEPNSETESRKSSCRGLKGGGNRESWEKCKLSAIR